MKRAMLDFWILKVDEDLTFLDGAVDCSPCRAADFSIGMSAFEGLLKNGLEQLASRVGLSYLDDALINVESSKKLLIALEEIDKRLNPSGARTECRVMAELFSLAVDLERPIVVVCD